MSATIEASAPAAFTLQDAQQFLYREARALDDRDWDAWLALYAPDAEFWMPSWDDNEPRTSHNISNLEILEQTARLTKLRFNWVTFSYRYKTVDIYFGASFYTIDTTGAQPLIRRKKVVLKNDYIHHVVDIYHI